MDDSLDALAGARRPVVDLVLPLVASAEVGPQEEAASPVARDGVLHLDLAESGEGVNPGRVAPVVLRDGLLMRRDDAACKHILIVPTALPGRIVSAVHERRHTTDACMGAIDVSSTASSREELPRTPGHPSRRIPCHVAFTGTHGP
ncbi:unnamed protein product [Lampetra planeri]